MNLTEETIDRLESLAKLATEGPWVVDALDNDAKFNIDVANGNIAVAQSQQVPGDHLNAQRTINAAYIAAANPQTVRCLLRERRLNPLIKGQAAWGRLNEAILSLLEAQNDPHLSGLCAELKAAASDFDTKMHPPAV